MYGKCVPIRNKTESNINNSMEIGQPQMKLVEPTATDSLKTEDEKVGVVIT